MEQKELGVQPGQRLADERDVNGLPRRSGAVGAFLVFAVVLSVVFAKVLDDWAIFAWNSDLYSHLILIPFVSAYLVWLKRDSLAVPNEPFRLGAVIPLLGGLALIAGFWLAKGGGWKIARVDYLAWHMLGFVSLLLSGAWFSFGSQVLRKVMFPAGFLFLAAPFPSFLLEAIVTALQYGSAEVSYLMLTISGMPLLRSGMVFELPGISMEVAPQCSGIHSTVVLFIVSLVAGYLFLRRPGSRAVLALAILPLALLRNGLRIFTIGQLCVQVSPEMINSYIHKQGGPIFFALSLIPFFLLLLLLKNLERNPPSNKA